MGRPAERAGERPHGRDSPDGGHVLRVAEVDSNLADAENVLAGVRRRDGVTYAVLVPNLRGLERELAATVDEVVIFVSASESHNQRNINKTIAQALETYQEVAARTRQAGLRLKAALSTCFGCPYEGDVDPAVVLRSPKPCLAWEWTRLGSQIPREWRTRSRCVVS